MSSLEKLIKHFERFPGIGSRQARRFADYLLHTDEGTNKELAGLIADIKLHVTECTHCFRHFAKNSGVGADASLCSICADPRRDSTKLMVVERDSDIQAIERSGIYDGHYFVFGGMVPLLKTDEVRGLRSGTLKRIVEERINTLSEIILGFAVNPDGENTARFIEKILEDTNGANVFTVSKLGRGLSTGSELEYADPETIKNALQNRH